MADNSTQTGADTIATDDVATLNGGASSGVKVQRVKVGFGDDGTARDVSTSFPLPVQIAASGGLATTAGSITASAANTPGSAVTASTTGQIVAATSQAGNATFHLVTTAFVGTLQFEGSVDGGFNYAPVMSIREDGTGAETSTLISTGAAFIRQYTVALPGLAYFRVRASGFTSGSVAVLIAPGPTLIEPSPSLAGSSATIGNLGSIGELRATVTSAGSTGAAAAAVTSTLPAPGAGLFHYITHLSIDLYSSAARTGVATPITVSTTNLAGTPAFTFSSAGAIGAVDRYVMPLTTPYKSGTANTATTIVAPAVTGGIWRINVNYFTAA